MLGWLSDASICASYLKTRDPLLIVHKASGKNFDRHLAAESRVPGAINFSHPAGAQKRKNFVRPDLPSQERFRKPLHRLLFFDPLDQDWIM